MEKPRLKLSNGSRIAVIGAGPAGSFFSYFLIDMAERVGIKLDVDVFESRDFNMPGPRGCNMCAGVLHESLVQSLFTEGIALPPTVVQRGIDSNILHLDVGHIRIETPRHEKSIATTYRAAGPRDLRKRKWDGLDGHLLNLAVHKGANPILDRVDDIVWVNDMQNPDVRTRRLQVKTRSGMSRVYDLVAVNAGVNTKLLRQLDVLGVGYEAPRTTKCHVREYYLGEEAVTLYLGSSMHAFLLNIPGLDFGALVPKGEYVTLALLGENINEHMVQTFLNDPVTKECLPPDFATRRSACSCSPRINVLGSAKPFGDRIVFIGDSGVTRYYKDGIGSAYRAAKVSARTVIFEGISEMDFRRQYLPFCTSMRMDNLVGKMMFAIVRQIQKIRFMRRAVLGMVTAEQRGQASPITGMSMVLWDMFTGGASYREIFLRTLCPTFWTRLLWNVVILPFREPNIGNAKSKTMHPIGSSAVTGAQSKPGAAELGALGKVYQDSQVIIRQGEVGNCMFVIQEGQVEIVQELDGHSVRLAIRGEGEFFGEMSIFEREVRSATARALGRARVLTVDEKTLLRRIHEDPSLAYRMVRMMSRRIRELSKEVARLSRPGQRSFDESAATDIDPF